MITRISGILERVGPHAAVVATEAGLAYEVLIPAALATELAASDGQRVTFQTVQLFEPVGGGNALRPRLIGFLSESDRRFYELFTTVKGVGGRRALRAMAAPAARLARAIEDNDAAFLRGMPEIGKRLAETVIAELHGKVDEFLLSDIPGGAIAEVKPGGALDAAGEQAVEALVRLGQPRPEAEKAVGKAMERLPDAPSPDEILAAAFAGSP